MKTPEKLTWAATALCAAAVVVLALAGIWTGDGRYGWTALLAAAVTTVLFVAAAAQTETRTRGGTL